MGKEQIKKIRIDQLDTGMYVHDLNCPWIDHPFFGKQVQVQDQATLDTIRGLGIRELYIDVGKGADVPDAPTAEAAEEAIREQLTSIAGETVPARVPLAEEIQRARKLHVEANRIVKGLIGDIRLGRQIELEQVEPVVEGMIDSIFRCPDALLPLGRLKDHDQYTFQHSVSVCTLMIAFARGLGLPRDYIKEIAVGSLLHDVGKARVPDAILNKPAKLTDAEFAKMKSHVVQSQIILQHTPGIGPIALEVAGQHHERFDGTGYPNRLKGDEISFHGQMGAIVDVYDAITSNRVYHKGMSPPQAMGRLLEWSRFHFNPDLVKMFIKSIGIYPTGSLVRLQSGRLGVVLEQNLERAMQPRLRVIYHAEHKHYLPPEDLDLAAPNGRDGIVGHEAFETWGIDPQRWLPG